MNVKEIIEAVKSGKIVNWKNELYEVRHDHDDQYCVVCTSNEHTVGLTKKSTGELIGNEKDFTIQEPTGHAKGEMRSGEMFLGNNKLSDNRDHFKSLKTIRLGSQALDINGGMLPAEYIPLFIKKSEYPAYDKIMMDRSRKIRRGY